MRPGHCYPGDLVLDESVSVCAWRIRSGGKIYISGRHWEEILDCFVTTYAAWSAQLGAGVPLTWKTYDSLESRPPPRSIAARE